MHKAAPAPSGHIGDTFYNYLQYVIINLYLSDFIYIYFYFIGLLLRPRGKLSTNTQIWAHSRLLPCKTETQTDLKMCVFNKV